MGTLDSSMDVRCGRGDNERVPILSKIVLEIGGSSCTLIEHTKLGE